MNGHVGLEVRGNIENLSRVSNFIGNSMLKFGLNDYEQFQIQIAVDEAITNIIKHGNLGEKNKIQVKCQKRENEIKIVIEDKGKPFDPTKAEQKSLSNSEKMRVYFTKKNMNESRYEFKDGKNVLTLIKRI
ncbi:ATP-binding protein [Methanobacterium oryzae]|uniref:ATP-binding protein n=1 Tax=Methanobacterium oryzae TaxID=69540 RepID=UPI003D2252F8